MHAHDASFMIIARARSTFMAIFNIQDFEGIYVNFDRVLIDETLWIRIGDCMLRYEYDRLYVDGSIYEPDIEVNSLINSLNEAINLSHCYGVAFILAKHREVKEYIATNAHNLAGWLDHNYHLVGVVTR